MKNREDIERKYRKLVQELDYSCKIKLGNKMKEIYRKQKAITDKEIAKWTRKIESYKNKKIKEYDRKCKNEIRKLEGKPERVYKKKKKLNLVEFAMQIMQENAKLRDTDISGNGYCVSCDKFKTRKELAGGHRWSRRIKNICLSMFNINAQCHGCNFTTGPRGDKVASDRVNAHYDDNLDKKFGEGLSVALKGLAESYFKNDYDEYWEIGYKRVKSSQAEKLLEEKYIPELIEENELRWRHKDFYSPSKKRRKIREDYKQS